MVRAGNTAGFLYCSLPIHIHMEIAAPPCSPNTVPTHRNPLLPRCLLPTAPPRVLNPIFTGALNRWNWSCAQYPPSLGLAEPWNLCTCHVSPESTGCQGVQTGELPCTRGAPETNCLSRNLDLFVSTELSSSERFSSEREFGIFNINAKLLLAN